jgi:hypothetical protein
VALLTRKSHASEQPEPKREKKWPNHNTCCVGTCQALKCTLLANDRHSSMLSRTGTDGNPRSIAPQSPHRGQLGHYTSQNTKRDSSLLNRCTRTRSHKCEASTTVDTFTALRGYPRRLKSGGLASATSLFGGSTGRLSHRHRGELLSRRGMDTNHVLEISVRGSHLDRQAKTWTQQPQQSALQHHGFEQVSTGSAAYLA